MTHCITLFLIHLIFHCIAVELKKEFSSSSSFSGDDS